MTRRRLRLGMVGGGQGAFFGAAHRMAARLTDRFELVAGALSSDPSRAVASAVDLHIAPERAYSDFRVMAKTEAERGDGIDLVAIVTPNHLHTAVARAFLDAGIHVMCDKPLATTLSDALDLEAIATQSGLLFGVTYTNVGFGMVREARAIVAAGALSALRVVRVEFSQEWLAAAVEATGNKQAEWRTDPARSGAGCLGDIGTHAFHLAEFVSGLRCEGLAAQVASFVPGRRVDDDANVLLRFQGGVHGALWASQVAIGHANGLNIRLYGERASLAWSVADANALQFARIGEPPQRMERAGPGTHFPGRLPSGHPEGFVEALAQLYDDIADQIAARLARGHPQPSALLLPNAADGARGLRFIDAALRSGRSDGAWVDL